ncbi:MAG TPA: sugar phosphate nucleotidyltransferase [Methylomirabilota bacterium]|nr:sugar phosphate nucleotidyltransferase [Methylomirabilota bacterium]
MLEQAFTCSEPLAAIRERDRDGDLWAVVLAGGEGSRLRALTRYLYGDERPKQYAVLTGSKSLLRQTLERVARLVPPSRIVVVAQASHDRYLGAELAGFPQIHVLAQPSDRGTAAGVLMPAHLDPRARSAGGGRGVPRRPLHPRGGDLHAPRGRGSRIRARAPGRARPVRRAAQ